MAKFGFKLQTIDAQSYHRQPPPNGTLRRELCIPRPLP